jgi:MarR family transcriptional regulator, transcriptional regulator for hemolysin
VRPIDHEFLFLLYDVAQAMRTRADRRASASGMTRAQWAILARLERQPGLTQNEMAAWADVEPITIGRLVDRLQAQDLVERRPDAADRRVWRLYLTPQAKPVLREIAAFREEFHRHLTYGINAATLKIITKGLLRMKANLAP